MDAMESAQQNIGVAIPLRPPARAGERAITLYTPDDRIGMGLRAWRDMVRELVDSRELTWRLFLRDFSARYRQSILGYVWAVVPVLLTVATFTWLNRSSVLAIRGTALPYPLFVLLGMTVWQLFASGLTGATQSLVNAGSLITKINFPRETLVLAAFGQSVFEFAIRAALVAAGFALWRIAPSWTILLIPAALIPLCLFTMGLGYLLALVNGVMRDAGQLVTFLLTFWMFLTPVVYPASARHGLLQALNPVGPFVTASQDLATRHTISQPAPYALACAIGVAVFLFGWRVFHLTETRIAERV
jgi:lipopolysaccharide transport system permease protein